MSRTTDGPLSEGDQRVLDYIDEQIEEAEDEADYEAIARLLRDNVEDLRREFRVFQNDVGRRLSQLENGAVRDDVEDEEKLPIDVKANLPREELTTSEEIAVALHENWSEIAWSLGDGETFQYGVNTRTKATTKNAPSKLRHELRRELDRDLAPQQIYRGLKRLATLSGGEERVHKADGRVHIADGLYEYRERTPPTGGQTRRVLWRETE